MVISTDHGERMEGGFVETAYTNEQVTSAIDAERKLGFEGAECAFLGGDPVPGAGRPVIRVRKQREAGHEEKE